jgi:hypothetical protein
VVQVTRYRPDQVAFCNPGPPWSGRIDCHPGRGPVRVVEPSELPVLSPALLSQDNVRYPYAFVVPSQTPVIKRVAVINRLVRQDLDDPDLAALAARCVADSDGTPRGIAQSILEMQNREVLYTNDPGRLEVFQSARYSFARRRGDCEDKAIAFATIAILAALESVCCWLTQPPPAPNNHVAPKVCLTRLNDQPYSYVQAIWDYRESSGRHNLEITCPEMIDGTWVWAETTLVGARVGEHPYDALDRIGRESPQRAHL